MPPADLPFGKGPTRKAEKASKRQHRADLIRAVRVQVMQRDLVCRVCSSTRDAEMHEIVPRSLLRGQPPEDIYTLANCLRLCSRCHGKVTRHEIALVPASNRLGANGRVEVQLTLRSRHVQAPTD